MNTNGPNKSYPAPPFLRKTRARKDFPTFGRRSSKILRIVWHHNNERESPVLSRSLHWSPCLAFPDLAVFLLFFFVPSSFFSSLFLFSHVPSLGNRATLCCLPRPVFIKYVPASRKRLGTCRPPAFSPIKRAVGRCGCWYRDAENT